MSTLQNQKYRWLEIGNTVQTVMDLSQPYNPVLPHLHGMLLSMYYQLTPPDKILELGLGGGALQRFFAHHFPDTAFHSIEIDENIINLFLEYFSLGIPHPETKVTQGDAQIVINDYKNIDTLFIDLFSGNAPPDFINNPDFYRDCFEALSPDGIIIINLLPVAEFQTMDVENLLLETSGFPPAIFSIPLYKNRILISAKRRLLRIPFNKRLKSFCDDLDIDLMNVVQIK